MSRKTFARRTSLTIAAALAVCGLAATTTSATAAPAEGAKPAWNIPDVSPKPYQRVGKVTPFFDLGNYDNISPSGAHWCQAEGRDGKMGTIAGRMWMFVEDYTTDAESLYKNDATITVSGWANGQKAFNKFASDDLFCTWKTPQTRLTWGEKNPQRYWLSTSGKVNTKYQVTGAVRVGDMIVSVTAGSTDAATAREMATRMTVAVERNLRATDLVRVAS